jgi:insulysin
VQAGTNIRIADEDARHLEKLTRETTIDFYTHYISPSSKQRSKLSVHLQAQSKSEKPTLDEKKASAISTCQDLFTEHKIELELTSHINNTSSAAEMLDTISAYLGNVPALKSDITKEVLDKIKAIIGVEDSGLPLELEASSTTAYVHNVTDASPPVLIEDIDKFKLSMQVSAGCQPARGLEDFATCAE